MTSRDISEETAQLSADLLDCDRNDYAKVNEIIDRIAELVPIHIKTSNNQYLYENDFAGSNQKDLYNGSVTVHGLSQLQRTCTPWLVSLLNKPPRLPDMVKDSNELDVFTDRLSSIISLLCGRAAIGECTTTWNFQTTGNYSIMETTFTEAEIGFQTWGSGVLLAKMIDQKVIDVAGQNVLELGCGTGLSGLVAARSGAKLVVLTDYHPVVLSNVERNVEANNVESNAKVVKLDWLSSLSKEARKEFETRTTIHGGDVETPEQVSVYVHEDEVENPILTNTDFRLVIAADCIFDIMHSILVPKVAKRYLSKHIDARLLILIPHREKFKAEIAAFEENMLAEAWILEFSKWIEKSTINFKYYIYKLDQHSSNC
ncbi:hypothetical protein O5D80_006982 [Batrachochytrium dendrobatidis]|nr:hypothetical protein O5D80_006982 [Batrachochytrium dendrobatidis]